MKKKTIYFSEDGTEFESESDCVLYEEQKKEEKFLSLRKSMCRLSRDIFKRYNPDSAWEDCKCDMRNADICLRNTIVGILAEEKFDAENTERELLTMIVDSGKEREILNDYISMNGIKREAAVRRDYFSALKKVKRGRELSSILGYGFSSKDIKQLAKLHKEGKGRKKIEDLLEDCNFRYECGKFVKCEYEEFLKITTDEYQECKIVENIR